MEFDLQIDRKVLIRADASSKIGIGHVMRMLALGQLLLDDGYKVCFATIPDHNEILDRLRNEGFTVYCLNQDDINCASSDLTQLLNLAEKVQPTWIIIDGYHFDWAYEKRIKDEGYKLLRVDDIPKGHYYADVVLNQNYGSEDFKYNTEKYTKVLAGLKYVLLRREFRKSSQQFKIVRKRNSLHVLVSLGGSAKVNSAINNVISEGLSGLSDLLTMSILAEASNRNMAEEMLKADLAIVSVGSTMWELMHMHVPFLAVSLTPMQDDYLTYIALEGLCIKLGWHEDLNCKLVQEKTLSFIKDNDSREKMIEKYEALIGFNDIGEHLLATLRQMS